MKRVVKRVVHADFRWRMTLSKSEPSIRFTLERYDPIFGTFAAGAARFRMECLALWPRGGLTLLRLGFCRLNFLILETCDHETARDNQKMVMAQQSFSTGEASRATGVPARTMDYWARSGFLQPSIAEARGTGSDRRYSFADLVALRVAHVLRSGGVCTEALKPIIAMLRMKWTFGAARMIVTSRGVFVASLQKDLMRLARDEDYSIVMDLQRIVAAVKSAVGQ